MFWCEWCESSNCCGITAPHGPFWRGEGSIVPTSSPKFSGDEVGDFETTGADLCRCLQGSEQHLDRPLCSTLINFSLSLSRSLPPSLPPLPPSLPLSLSYITYIITCYVYTYCQHISFHPSYHSQPWNPWLGAGGVWPELGPLGLCRAHSRGWKVRAAEATDAGHNVWNKDQWVISRVFYHVNCRTS